MAWPLKLLLAVFLILAAAIGPTHGDAMVTGTVLCDQCKDGHVSLFDYPVLGEIYNHLTRTFANFVFVIHVHVVPYDCAFSSDCFILIDFILHLKGHAATNWYRA